MRSVPSVLVRVMASGSTANAAAQRATRWAMPRSGSGSSSARWSSAATALDVAGLVAAGVADGLLAGGVGPAGAVGDDVRVGGAQQAANDLVQGVELVVGGVG
jgi:hypothetical protein